MYVAYRLAVRVMADISIVVNAMTQPFALTTSALPTTVIETSAFGDKPILPPAGSVAGGGPTAGQLFPVGNR